MIATSFNVSSDWEIDMLLTSDIGRGSLRKILK